MDTCTATNGAWPTGWGWWIVVGVAAVAIITIAAGMIVKAFDKRHSTTR
ncbi:MAG: hypothetical protein INR66_16760 [Gordonia polyisoprenivorans]|nr:hypothetical protein [Gordonia polyisoprenivorans]